MLSFNHVMDGLGEPVTGQFRYTVWFWIIEKLVCRLLLSILLGTVKHKKKHFKDHQMSDLDESFIFFFTGNH